MSTTDDQTTSARRVPGWGRRIGVILGLVLLGLVGFAWWNFPSLNPYSAAGRHQRVLDRLNVHLLAASDAFVARYGRNELEWPTEVFAQGATLRVMQMSLYNTFWHADRQPEVAARLREVADQLDAGGGAELRTLDGCLRLFARFEAISPDFKAYGPTQWVYEWHREGKIPRLRVD